MNNKKTDTLLRRFAIIYIGFSVLPFLFIYYIFTLYDESKTLILISYDRFIILTFVLGAASLFGYFSMRSTLNRFVLFADSIKKSILGNVNSDIVVKLANEEGEIGEIAKSFAQIIKRLDENVQELEETKKTIHALMGKISSVLSSVENLDNLVRLVLETAVDALGVDKGVIFSFDNGRYILRSKVGTNPEENQEQLEIAVKSYLDLVAKENRLLVIPAMGEADNAKKMFAPPLICNPLNYRGKMMGVLLLCGKRYGSNFSDDDLNIVSNLSNQIAIAFENEKLNADAEQTYFETMAALAMAVEARDPYSRGHSDRVGDYARKIGVYMGLPNESLKVLTDASRLHDIGKIGIMDSILIKNGMLNTEERAVMNRHPIIGEGILMPLKTFKHLLDPVRHHHELLDGSGYPDGISGDDIKPITRILAIADVYDALVTDRSYRKAMKYDEAKKELDLLVNKGKLDGNIVSHLYSLVESGELISSL